MAVFLRGVEVMDFTCVSNREGNYAGNDSANRAIAHGLGRIPRTIIIRTDSGTTFFRINQGRGIILYYQQTVGEGEYAVTVPDVTNFYVGNAGKYGLSANGAGTTYRWWVFA
jgi:hypothetical protein